MSSSIRDNTIPRLAAPGGSATGLPYTQWRQQIQAHIARAGLSEKDYTIAIPDWIKLVKAVDQADQLAEAQAIQSVIAGITPATTTAPATTTGSSTTGSSTTATSSNKQTGINQAMTIASGVVDRSRKVFGILLQSLPQELCQLIPDQERGYAYGLWDRLEKKYRNTEIDSVIMLIKRFTQLTQEPLENFETYKARVDSMVELLSAANEKPSPATYAAILIWSLTPAYSPLVLVLKTNGLFKDPTKVDWAEVSRMAADYERSQQNLNQENNGSDFVGSTQQSWSNSKTRSKADRTCYNCKKTGHTTFMCPEKPTTETLKYRATRSKRGGRGGRRGRTSRAGQSSDDDEHNAEHANALSTQHRKGYYSALSELSDDEDQASSAFQLAAVSTPSATPAAAAAASSAPKPASASSESKKKTDVTTTQPKNKLIKPAQRVDISKEKDGSLIRPPRPLEIALRTTCQAIDTGATCTSVGNKELLVNVRRCPPMTIQVADGATIVCNAKGDLPLRLLIADSPNKYTKVVIKDAYYNERFASTLLSWGCMRMEGWEMHSNKTRTYLITPGGREVNCSTRAKLSIIEGAVQEFALGTRIKLTRHKYKTAAELVALHKRAGHFSWERLLTATAQGATDGIGTIDHMSEEEKTKAESLIRKCVDCQQGKAHRKPLGHRGINNTKRAGELLHMDTFVITNINPITRERVHYYVLLVIDSYSEHRWVKIATQKQLLVAEPKNIIKMIETITGKQVVTVHTDGGGEFDNQAFKDFWKDAGITHRMSPPRTPQLNGVAERGVRSVKEGARTLVTQSGLSSHFAWSHAITHHTHTWNRTHICKNTMRTPHEIITGKTPDLTNFGTFGCDAHVYQDHTQRSSTLNPIALPGVYLGHDTEHNCPKIYMLQAEKIISSKEAYFKEDSFEHSAAITSGDTNSIPAAPTSPSHKGASQHQTLTNNSSNSTATNTDSSALPTTETTPPTTHDQQEYEIEKITAERQRNNQIQYKVKWRGYTVQTWEPHTSLTETAALDTWENGTKRTKARPSQALGKSDQQRPPIANTRTLRSSPPTQPHSDTDTHRESSSDDDDENNEPLAAARSVAAQRL